MWKNPACRNMLVRNGSGLAGGSPTAAAQPGSLSRAGTRPKR